MGRSAASRMAEEVAAKVASMRPRQTKMGTCPVCGCPIYAHQLTTWRSVDGASSRVHNNCKDAS